MASLDPFRGYATALLSSMPDAVRVLDTLHVVRRFNMANAWRATPRMWPKTRSGPRDRPFAEKELEV